MKVSIVLPAYKRRFLKESLNSLLAQTYTNFELIIVDDASPEHLADIVGEYDDHRIRFYQNEKNLGKDDLVTNWNHCVNYACGELLLLASDDDVYQPTFLEKMVKLAIEHPECDLFHCRVAVINEEGRIIHAGEPISAYESDIDFIVQRALNRRTQLISDFIYRMDAFHRIGGFVNYPKAWFSDEMTCYLLAKGKGVWADSEALFHWRCSDVNISSATNDTLQKADASLKHLQNMQKLIPQLQPSNEFESYLQDQLTSLIQEKIAVQMLFDVEKSPLKLILKFILDKRYSPIRWHHFWIKLIVGKLRSKVF